MLVCTVIGKRPDPTRVRESVQPHFQWNQCEKTNAIIFIFTMLPWWMNLKIHGPICWKICSFHWKYSVTTWKTASRLHVCQRLLRSLKSPNTMEQNNKHTYWFLRWESGKGETDIWGHAYTYIYPVRYLYWKSGSDSRLI